MRVKIRMILAWLVAVALLLVAIFSDPVLAQTYYQGKTITVVRGGEPGGVGDMQAKALIPNLKKHIPGEPNIVVEHMPGAAGMKAVNYIYSSANPDGLRIGAVGAGLVSGPILGLPGAKYDLEKLLYLAPQRAAILICLSPGRKPVSTAWRNCARRRGSGLGRRRWGTRST